MEGSGHARGCVFNAQFVALGILGSDGGGVIEDGLGQLIDGIFVGIGEWRDGVHNNYVCKLEANGIDGTVYHKYALCNEPVFSGGQYVSNMVYLYVDDAKVGPLNHYYTGSTDTGTTVDWLNGRDLVFSTIGTEVFTVGGCTMEYLQVKTGCAHDFGSWTVKTADGSLSSHFENTVLITKGDPVILTADHSKG